MQMWPKRWIDSSVLPLALAGSLGRCYWRNSCLVQGSRYFVDVVQGKKGEYQAGWKKWESKRIRFKIKYIQIQCKVGVWDLQRYCYSPCGDADTVHQARGKQGQAQAQQNWKLGKWIIHVNTAWMIYMSNSRDLSDIKCTGHTVNKGIKSLTNCVF